LGKSNIENIRNKTIINTALVADRGNPIRKIYKSNNNIVVTFFHKEERKYSIKYIIVAIKPIWRPDIAKIGENPERFKRSLILSLNDLYPRRREAIISLFLQLEILAR
jgi:hypothetical protein